MPMTRDEVLGWLKRKGTRRTIEGLDRYGIEAGRVFGVPMGQLLTLGKKIGRNQELSLDLWATGWYEARLLAALIGEPEKVSRQQMNRWAGEFENWADCDTVCFKLFDRSPFAWEKARQWSQSPREFVKRGGFVLMACLALHDKAAPDSAFLKLLPLIEKGAVDERNLVRKGVSWALRSIATRSRALKSASLRLANNLAESDEAAPRWVGKDVLRQLRRS